VIPSGRHWTPRHDAWAFCFKGWALLRSVGLHHECVRDRRKETSRRGGHPTGLPLVRYRSQSPSSAWLPGDSEARKEVEYSLAESIGDRRVLVVENLGAVLARVERDDLGRSGRAAIKNVL
jgi:hypothetical protein